MIGGAAEVVTGSEPPDKQMWNVLSEGRPAVIVCGSVISVTRWAEIRASLAPPYQEGQPPFANPGWRQGDGDAVGCATDPGGRRLPLPKPRCRQLGELGSGACVEEACAEREVQDKTRRQEGTAQ